MYINMKTRRLLADFFDYYIIGLAASYISCEWFFPEFKFKEASKSEWIILILVELFISFLFWIFKDCAFGNASIGKKIFGIKIIYTNRENNGKIDILTHLKRSIPLLFLFYIEMLLVVSINRRLGDIWSKTAVVNKWV